MNTNSSDKEIKYVLLICIPYQPAELVGKRRAGIRVVLGAR